MKNIELFWHLILVLALWIPSGWIWFYVPPSPIEYLPGNGVTPAQAKVGEVFKIRRNFKVSRKDNIYIKRTMVKCVKNDCETLDLISGYSTLEPGVHLNKDRPFLVPLQADPGTWRLVFSYSYEDRLGRKIWGNLPELSIEVVK